MDFQFFSGHLVLLQCHKKKEEEEVSFFQKNELEMILCQNWRICKILISIRGSRESSSSVQKRP